MEDHVGVLRVSQLTRAAPNRFIQTWMLRAFEVAVDRNAEQKVDLAIRSVLITRCDGQRTP